MVLTSSPTTLLLIGACYLALHLLIAHDLGRRTALPLAHCVPHSGFVGNKSCDLTSLCKCTEPVPSIKMALEFSVPQNERLDAKGATW